MGLHYCLPSWWGCLFSTLIVKVSDDWSIILIERNFFFFKLETPKLLTVYGWDGERVFFSMTRNRIEIWHISSLTFSFSCPPHAKIDNYGNSSARTIGQSFRYLPHGSQTCSLRESWILMAERLAKKTVMKHFCGLSIMVLSVKRWSLIKSRLSGFLLAC